MATGNQTATLTTQWNWGVCGFVSALSALHDHKVIDLGHYTGEAERRDLVLSLTKDFVRQKQNTPLAQQIQAFTQTFHGFESWTLQAFLESECSYGTPPARFGIALTPDAVVDFLQYVKRGAGRLEDVSARSCGHCILGLGKNPAKPHNGLRHWVYYRDDTTVYSWGKIYTLTQLKKEYPVTSARVGI